MRVHPKFRIKYDLSTVKQARKWLQQYLDRLDKPPVAENTQITLVELTIRAIVGAIELWASDIRKLLVCGGGIHNEILYKRLRFSVGDYRVESTEDHGMHPDWVEAATFAWLAKQTLARQSGNIPSVTGASASVILGAIYLGQTQEE